MKKTLRKCLTKRLSSSSALAVCLLSSPLLHAQESPAAPADAAPAAPAVSPTETPAPSPVVTPPAPSAPEAAPPATAAAAPSDVPSPVAPPADDAEKYKHIDMAVWMRLDATLQNPSQPKKLTGLGATGDVEFHFSNQMRKHLAWTANLVATYGAGSIDGSSTAGADGVTPDPAAGHVGVLDLIAQFEPDEAFNVWVGRMLVASDRANFSGPWFAAPWIYPLFLGPQTAPFAVVGPKQGPFGRNDGATIWGQFGGGVFKYYLAAVNLHDAVQKPLLSGRLNLSLLNPEPGYYHSSTYYGMDLLAIGVGGQYQKNGDAADTGAKDYGLFNADILFEKNLQASGVIDVEGAFYKYIGDNEALKWSHYVLGSYLTPEITDFGRLQPLVRLQQAIPKGGGDTVTQIDAQVGYVVDTYATRFALGFTHASAGGGLVSNALFAGVQLQK